MRRCFVAVDLPETFRARLADSGAEGAAGFLAWPFLVAAWWSGASANSLALAGASALAGAWEGAEAGAAGALTRSFTALPGRR